MFYILVLLIFWKGLFYLYVFGHSVMQSTKFLTSLYLHPKLMAAHLDHAFNISFEFHSKYQKPCQIFFEANVLYAAEGFWREN